MKKMFLIFSVILLALSANSQDNAQKVKPNKPIASGKPTIEQKAQRSVEKLNNAVTLTEEQKTKIYALSLERENKLEAIKGKYKGPDGNIDKEAAKEDLKIAHKEYRKAVKEILTPDQIEILKQKAKEKKEAKKENEGNPENKGKDKKDKGKGDTEVEEIIPVE